MHAFSLPGAARDRLPRAADAPLVAGLACMLATNLVNSAAVMPMLRFDAVSVFMDTNARGYIWIFAIASLVTLGLVLARRRLSRRPAVEPVARRVENVVLIMGGALYLVGCCCVAYMGALGLLPSAAQTVTRVALGAGSFVAFLLWGRALLEFDLRRAIVVVGLGTVGSAALSLLFMHAPAPLACGAFALCAAVAVIVPLVAAPSQAVGYPVTAVAGEKPPSTGGIRSFLGVAAMPFLGLLFFSIILALQAWRFAEQYHPYCLSEALAALVAIALAVGLDTRILMRVAYRGVLPVVAVCAVAFTHVAASLDLDPLLGSLPSLLLYGLSILLALSTLVGMANAREFPVDLIVGAACAVFAAVTLAGPWLLGQFSLQSNVAAIDAIATVLTALYAVALVALSVAQGLAAERSMAEGMLTRVAALAQGSEASGGAVAVPSPADPSRTPSRQEISQACDRAAKTYGLTTREREILEYVVLGHSGVSVAEALIISPNTVRTHIFNINHKLGTSSREELARLVLGR